MSKEAFSILSSANVDYIGDLYQRYLQNPGAVDSSWGVFFKDMGDQAPAILGELQGASWTPAPEKIAAVLSSAANEAAEAPKKKEKSAAGGVSEKDVRAAAEDSIRALMLIRAYRVRGHLLCDLDPLGMTEIAYHPELDPKNYGFTDADFERPIYIGKVLGLETATLREIVSILQSTYCGKIGVEFMHIQDPDQKAWIQERIESAHNQTHFSAQQKKAILTRLTAAEMFEQFCDKKFSGTKRFGVDGGESLIPSVEGVIARAGELGVTDVVLGMAHRGRLNMLTNVFGKSFTAMFSEFQGTSAKPDDVQGSGDVKYHLGTSSDRDFDGNTIHISLTPNPSHLEIVNPVVIGKVRARQTIKGDTERSRVLPILIHGDAAVAGQGVVAETLMMCDLPGYCVGGTVHIVINNQIGFTTSPKFGRSGPYCTDVGKMVQTPIFHVNGDDVEAVVHVSRLAAEFRQQFKKDVFVDIYCYRRFGHNESLEPTFTQPLMYKAIKDKRTTREMYVDQLVSEGVLTAADAQSIVDQFNTHLEGEFKASQGYKPNRADMLEGNWSGIKLPSDDRHGKTAVGDDMLQKVGKALTTVPKGFDLNTKVARQMEAKKKMFETGRDIDWATAEALAFGTLLLEGKGVRLSGQDVGCGTFSQRHAVLRDQSIEADYIPLNQIDAKQAHFQVHDSPLSEAAVLGFEYGYTSADPHSLVLWEGQFGDFVNGAQVVIDQFIVSAESKWQRMSGLVMLLPHGSEGQGPEHSSGRPERFLQLCAEDNIQVVNCTTPANYFHVLRRQLHRNFRKPLVIMTPKSLLRHKLCVSPLKMFSGKEIFRTILPDETAVTDVKRVVLCSGKVYYDLFEEREKRGIKDVALVRVEKLYPFPAALLGQELAKYPAAEVIWCQEEPENQGYWTFVDRRIEKVLTEIKHKTKRPVYIGREAAAAPATGSNKAHNKEQAKLIDEALTVK